MAKYFKFFRIPFIIVGVITVATIGLYISRMSSAPVKGNTQTDITQNVFNYAGNLTDTQVANLDSYISEIEEKTGIDIAVVTLDETLEYYVEQYEDQLSYTVTPDKWVMVYADNFADEHAMGYDAPYGSSLVFVDNLHREEVTGKVYSWISTSGYAMEKITMAECEDIMNDALYNLNDYSSSDDYFRAYKDVVALVPEKIGVGGSVAGVLSVKAILIVAAVVAGLFILVNIKSKVGKRTTTAITYVPSGMPNIREQKDYFLRKSVSKVKIETSSGGGGSGSHRSAGGHSHGGGGHSR